MSHTDTVYPGDELYQVIREYAEEEDMAISEAYCTLAREGLRERGYGE